ncbi:MAG: nucleotidyltransferase substrate binding protein [Thermodesulfovibrio sp.]
MYTKCIEKSSTQLTLGENLLYQDLHEDTLSKRDAIKTAFKYGIIENGDIWLRMISARNLTSHTYNEGIVE